MHMHICFAQVVTVSDDEMREATRALYRAGVVAEVSGAAAVAAVLAGKLGDVSGMHPCRKRAPPRVGQNGAEQASPTPEDARGWIHLGAASLGQAAAWVAVMLAGHTARRFPLQVCTWSARCRDATSSPTSMSTR